MNRLRYTTKPTPHIELASTPSPGCWGCNGSGYREMRPVGTEKSYSLRCNCWEPGEYRTILPVPGWIARRIAVKSAPEPL